MKHSKETMRKQPKFVVRMFQAVESSHFLSCDDDDSYAGKLFRGNTGSVANPKYITTEIIDSVPTPFKLENSYSFFKETLLERDTEALYKAFSLEDVEDKSFEVFCHACALAFKDFCTYVETDITKDFGDYYKEASSSSLGYEDTPTPEDYDYLEEAHGRCPFCDQKLAPEYKGVHWRNYKIVKLFSSAYGKDFRDQVEAHGFTAPSNEMEPKNLIALCRHHASLYESTHDFGDYETLVSTKKSMEENKKLEFLLDDEDLRSRIEKVIDKLLTDFSDKEKKLSTKALRISEKISENERFFYAKVKDFVVTYYPFIDSYLTAYEAKTENGSTVFGKKIKALADRYYHEMHLTEQETFNRLSSDMNGILGESSKDPVACSIVVAYFIQHCEVFSNEIPE